ncbi:MAG: AraC family transcriptional regulator [Bacteroidales bacterium]
MEDGRGFSAEYITDSDGLWHFHPEYELVLNLKSSGTRIVGDSIELFDRYDMVLIAGNIPHSWNHHMKRDQLPDKHGIVVRFRKSSFGDEFLKQFEMRPLVELLELSERGLRFSVDDAMRVEPNLVNMVHNKGMDKLADLFAVLALLCGSDNKTVLCSENYKREFDERGNKKMADVYTYIRENYYKPITLSRIAKVAKMNPMSFSRYFKNNSGAGFVEYLNRVRINRACYLLRETDYHIKLIAKECGFTSISNFNKTFKKTQGMSPRDYRSMF